MDWNMPVMDGYEFLGYLRRLRTRFTPAPMKYIMKPFGKYNRRRRIFSRLVCCDLRTRCPSYLFRLRVRGRL